jgi:hypothetical protein
MELDLTDFQLKTVTTKLAGKEAILTQLVNKEWGEFKKRGFWFDDLDDPEAQLVLIELSLKKKYPQFKDGLPEGAKITYLESSLAVKEIVSMENLEDLSQAMEVTEGA